MVGQNINRTNYTPAIDVAALKEVVNHNPFVDAAKWGEVLDALRDVGPGGPTTARSVKERILLLLEYFKKDQMVKINKSGTDEQYTEREQLLQEVLDLYNDRDRMKMANKAQKKAVGQPTDIRKRAMETLKEDEHEQQNTEDGKENTKNDDSVLRSPSTKRMRISGSMAKREMISYLETKNDNIKIQQDREMELRKEELTLNKARFELEKKEKDAKLEAEKLVQTADANLRKEEIALRREEIELNKAKFELERREREARMEHEKQEKTIMLDMMRNILATQNKM